MRAREVIIFEADVTAVLKGMSMATISIFSAIYTGLTAVVGADGSNTLAIGTTLGVSVTFAGLILRMVIKNQSAIWDIVRAKEKEVEKKEAELLQARLDKEYLEWEREQARFRAKERTDPGAFKPSPSLKAKLEGMDTMN